MTWKVDKRLIISTAFEKARLKELQGLLNQGVFAIMPIQKAKGCRVYGSRFVDEIKNAGQPNAYEKSRLVVQGYNDKDHGLMTYAPTTQRASQRLLLAILAVDPSL